MKHHKRHRCMWAFDRGGMICLISFWAGMVIPVYLTAYMHPEKMVITHGIDVVGEATPELIMIIWGTAAGFARLYRWAVRFVRPNRK